MARRGVVWPSALCAVALCAVALLGCGTDDAGLAAGAPTTTSGPASSVAALVVHLAPDLSSDGVEAFVRTELSTCSSDGCRLLEEVDAISVDHARRVIVVRPSRAGLASGWPDPLLDRLEPLPDVVDVVAQTDP